MTRPPEPHPRSRRPIGKASYVEACHDDAMQCAARGLAAAIERSDPDAAAAIDFWQARLRVLDRP